MKIGIFGFGGVGAALYNELNKYDDLYVLVDENRKNRYIKEGLTINNISVNPKYITNGKMDLVFICLKNYQLDSSLKDLMPFIDNNTILAPIQNGITATAKVKSYFPNNKVLSGCIYVESNKVGNACICSKIIKLCLGYEDTSDKLYPLPELEEIFKKYDLTYVMPENIKRVIWTKWCLNLGINQISALTNSTYKDMSHPLIQELFISIFKEVFMVANAYNIGLKDEDFESLKERISKFNSNRVTSLTVDFNKKGPNELESFGAVLIDLADKKNIDIPVNKTLYKLLKSYYDNKIKC